MWSRKPPACSRPASGAAAATCCISGEEFRCAPPKDRSPARTTARSRPLSARVHRRRDRGIPSGGGIGIVRLLGILRPRFRHLDASRQQQDRRSGEQRVSYRACFHGTKIGENRTGATWDCKWFRTTFRPVKASLRPRNRANRKYQRLFGAFFFLRTDQPK